MGYLGFPYRVALQFDISVVVDVIVRNYYSQGSKLTFQLSSQVASERFDFTSQNKFSLASLFGIISYCVRRLKILTRGIQSTMCLQGKFPGAM